MSPAKTILALIKEKNILFLDCRFTDILGTQHHVTLPTHHLTEEILEQGIPFDGSSSAGWCSIDASDMLLKLDLNTVVLDPFYAEPSLSVFCDVFDPLHQAPYSRDPRGIAARCEQYLSQSGIGEVCYFGPELEFFVFERAQCSIQPHTSSYHIESLESPWPVSAALTESVRFPLSLKGGYMALPPYDSLHDLRSDIILTLEKLGVPTEIHHHEVATAGQCEIGTRFASLLKRADWTQHQKHVIKNVCHMYNKQATFMPKPFAEDNGSGMHCHISIWKQGDNLFAGQEACGLSRLALYFIGGILHHARALNAFTNPAVNSYRRLLPGFEAPVKLAYSSCNRSVAIRVPYHRSSSAARIELRFPDALTNPYLGFSAMLMAGIDGIRYARSPGDEVVGDAYAMTEEMKSYPSLARSLEEALSALDGDRDFLLAGGVFTNDFLDAYIAVKEKECLLAQRQPTPLDFSLYF